MKGVFNIKKENQKGITLIALIITIIVLLILSTISLTFLSGENGIISRAIESRELTNEEHIKELVEVVIHGSYGNNGYDEDKLKENLEKELGVDPNDIVKDGDGNLLFPYNNYEITVKDNKEANQKEVVLEKGVYPKVKIKLGAVTGTTIEINVEVTNRKGDIEEGTYEYYIDDEEVAREVSESSSYKYKDLIPQTSHKVKVNFTDKNGRRKTVSEKVVTGKAIPVIQSVDVATKTPTTITIKANATHETEEKLKYELYIENEKQDTIENKTSGEDVYLTAKDLSNYTDYNYYVIITDESNNTIQTDTKQAKTQCTGTTKTCSDAYSWTCSQGWTESCSGRGSSYTCSGKGSSYTCDGKGSSYTCSPQSAGSWVIDHFWCDGGTNENSMKTLADVNHHLQYFDHRDRILAYWKCSVCGASYGNPTKYFSQSDPSGKHTHTCTHGNSSSHTAYYACSHGYTSSHTAYYACSHGQTSSHTAYYPCSHNRTSSHTVYHYCTHNYTSSHTVYEKCSHKFTSSHKYCEHNFDGKAHD